MQAGPPATSTVDVPRASTLAELVARTFTTDGPSTPTMASLTLSEAPSNDDVPRTIAVSLGATPAAATLPAPLMLIFS